jgi:hypothetical protein
VDKLLHRQNQSKAERQEPRRERPYTLSELPKRICDLQLRELAKFVKSNTEIFDPTRAMPKTLSELPRRPQWRTESADPKEA